MKEELLKRYVLGDCNEVEIEAVAQWISSVEDEESILSQNILHDMEANVWQSVCKKRTKKDAKIIALANPWTNAAMAACLVVLIMSGIAVLNTVPHIETIQNRLGKLQVTGGNGKISLHTEDELLLDFSGYVQLINASGHVKKITCVNDNGKTYMLLPGETYYLETVMGGQYLIREKYLSPERDFANYLRGDFHIKPA